MEKTNVMRILDAAHISYQPYEFATEEAVSGVEVARILHLDEERVFKTLVTVGASKRNYVFVIPVAAELSLKKAAKVVGEKSIEMIKSRELLPLTGYVHGGCSPIGMKKAFPTVIDEQVILCEEIVFSAGKIGYQVELAPDDLKQLVEYSVADVTM